MIDFYNYLFRSVFSGGNDPAPYEAGFLPLKAGGGGPQVLPEINILYKPFDAEEDTGRFASGDETEAYYLAEYIKSRVEGKTLPVRDGTVLRPAVYSDFALLMRSTGSQAVYERIFRQFGIPYSSDNVRTLFLEAPLNDFYSILQLAVFPSDKTAYAAYLRSPLLGCSDETMLKLLLIADEENGPFSENADGIEMTKTDRERYTKGKELFLFLRKNIGTMPIGKIVQHIWFDRGYRYLLMTNRAYHPYLEYYDYLYYLAVDADRRGQTVTEFLDFMRRNLGKYERLEDFDNLKEAAEGVQILTIHKSKGLEFPVVLLANTGNAGSKSGGPELFYVSPEYGLTFSGSGTGGSGENYFYTLMADENKKMETAELKRLLYVACTRAKDHLIISGYHHRNNRNDDGAMLNMILHAAGISDVSGEHAAGGKAVFRRMSPLLKNRVRYRLAADTENVEEKINAYLRRPVLQFSIDRRDFSVTEIAEYQHVSDGEGGQAELPVFEWEKEWEDTAAEEGFSASVGTLAHCIIEQKITGTYGPASIPELYLKAFPAALRPRIISSLEEVTEGFFSSPLGEQLRRARRFETEYDFVSRYLSGGREYFIYGRMDLFFETETSAYVIDFKTDRVIVPAVHDTQLQLYGKAAASLSGKTPECRLFFLRDGTVRVVKPDPAFVPLFPRAAADTAVWR